MSTPAPERVAAHPEQMAAQLAEAVARCPNVARLSGGFSGGVATYLPGRRIPGVVIHDGDRPEVRIHVVGRYGPTMEQIAAEVDQAVHALLPDHRIQINIDDLDIDPAGGHPSD